MTIEKFIRNRQQLAISLGKEESAVIVYMLYVTGYTSSELFIHSNDKMTQELEQKFDEGFNEYLYKNRPIQYVVQSQAFFGYDYYVDERVLIPRYETEELVENVLELYDEYFKGQKVDACDIGTGSGAIAITLNKEEPNIHVIATDISEDAIEVAKKNIETYGANVETRIGDMLEPLFGNKFDIICSNPPYIPTDEEVQDLVKDNEPNIALFGGDDGLKFYRIIFKDAAKIMKDKCILAFEHGYNKKEEMRALALSYFPNAKVISKKDLEGKDRMTFVLVGDFDEAR